MDRRGILKEDEVLHIGLLDTLVPLGLYIGEGLSPYLAYQARRTLTVSMLSTVWGARLGDPTGPGGVHRAVDVAAKQLVGGIITQYVALLRAP